MLILLFHHRIYIIIDKYGEKIKNLKHIIIDMYDYEYFNFDTSLAKNIYRYFLWGGYNLDGHNMTRNKIYTNSLEEVRNYLLYSKYKGLDISLECGRNCFQIHII